jgi:hypothetical protein
MTCVELRIRDAGVTLPLGGVNGAFQMAPGLRARIYRKSRFMSKPTPNRVSWVPTSSKPQER